MRHPNHLKFKGGYGVFTGVILPPAPGDYYPDRDSRFRDPESRSCRSRTTWSTHFFQSVSV